MTGFETIASNLDSLSLSLITAVGPRVNARVFKASVLELGAVNCGFCPCLGVGVVGAIVILMSIYSMECLLPLKHLDLTFKAV